MRADFCGGLPDWQIGDWLNVRPRRTMQWLVRHPAVTAADVGAGADGEEEEEITFTDPAKNAPFRIFIGKIQSWEICSRNEMSWYCSYFSLFPSLTG